MGSKQDAATLVSAGEVESVSKVPSGIVHACVTCGKLGGPTGVRLLKCSACNGPRYCSKECQKQAWPSHKAGCKSSQETRRLLTGAAGADCSGHFDKWMKKCLNPFTRLVHTLLRGRLDTHVAVLLVHHTPDKAPPFQVSGVEVVAIDDLGQTQFGGTESGLRQLLAERGPQMVAGQTVRTGMALLAVHVSLADGRKGICRVMPASMADNLITDWSIPADVYIQQMNSIPWL